MGGAGYADSIMMGIAWLEEGGPKPDLVDRSEDWSGILVIAPDGAIWKFEKQLHGFLVEAPQFAIGSGRAFAIGAMAMGATAREAVEVASRFDPHSGMGVDVLELASPRSGSGSV